MPSAVRCSKCNKKGLVTDSRENAFGITRRRKCQCGERWSTKEVRAGGGGDYIQVETMRSVMISIEDDIKAAAKRLMKLRNRSVGE